MAGYYCKNGVLLIIPSFSFLIIVKNSVLLKIKNNDFFTTFLFFYE